MFEAVEFREVKLQSLALLLQIKHECKTILHAILQALRCSALAHQNRGVASGPQGCAWERVKGGTGIELL